MLEIQSRALELPGYVRLKFTIAPNPWQPFLVEMMVVEVLRRIRIEHMKRKSVHKSPSPN